MCIIFANQTTRPDDDILRRADERNSDGIGVAWRDADKVRWRKGLQIGELLELIPEIPFPHVIHFRAATVGGEIDELTHPFPVKWGQLPTIEGTAPAVLFHNGHWHDWRKALLNVAIGGKLRIPKGPFSDSRALACITAILGPESYQLFELESQRIALLGTKELALWGNWTKSDDKGHSYSNPSAHVSWAPGGMNIAGKGQTSSTTTLLARRAPDRGNGGTGTKVEDGEALTTWQVKEIAQILFHLRVQNGRNGILRV